MNPIVPKFKLINLTFVLSLLILQFNCIKSLKAQHCKWDGSEILVFSIRADESDTLSINNLKVTVVDSAGTSYFYPYTYQGKTISVQVIPFQNVIDPLCEVKKIHRTIDVRSFWFAKSNYVLVGPLFEFGMKGLCLVIEDIDGMENGGRFEKRIIRLNQKKGFPLCSNFSHWESGSKMGFVKEYKPIDVILKRVENK